MVIGIEAVDRMIRRSYIFVLVIGWTILTLAILGCSKQATSAKAPAASQIASPRDEMADRIPVSNPESAMERSMPDNQPTQKIKLEQNHAISDDIAVPNRQDPFNLLPKLWPPDLKLHPDARVAQSVENKAGYTLVTLIPSDRATVTGVQGFYLELLSSWESLQVHEVTETSKGAPIITIVAERPNAVVEVRTENATPAFMNTLANKDFWIREVGPTPVIARLSYHPKS
jgi:hypothetical protein